MLALDFHFRTVAVQHHSIAHPKIHDQTDNATHWQIISSQLQQQVLPPILTRLILCSWTLLSVPFRTLLSLTYRCPLGFVPACCSNATHISLAVASTPYSSVLNSRSLPLCHQSNLLRPRLLVPTLLLHELYVASIKTPTMLRWTLA